jgi:hypothetical protein
MSLYKHNEPQTQSQTEAFESLSDIIRDSGILDSPHYRVCASRRISNNLETTNIIHNRYYHTLWEAQAIAYCIQNNFLRSRLEPKYKDIIFIVDTENNFSGEYSHWQSDWQSLKFKEGNFLEDLEDEDDNLL